MSLSVTNRAPYTNGFSIFPPFFWSLLKKIRFSHSNSGGNYLLNDQGGPGSLHATLLIWDPQPILPVT